MRRITVVLACALAALALPLVVLADTGDLSADFTATMSALGVSSSAPAAGADVTVGNGSAACLANCNFAPRNFQFAGASNLAAGDGHGIVHMEALSRTTGEVTGSLTAKVFCVSVDGNYGIVGAVVTENTSTGPAPGDAIYVPMIDNGQPGSTTPDLVGPTFFPGGPPTDVDGQCIYHFEPLLVVTQGDVKVHDGQVTTP